ncbi:MAG: hypothetical protein Q9210_006195 [Variospora velana]
MSDHSDEFAQLTLRIQRLPQELRNQIEECVYKTGLTGGFLHLRGGSKQYPGRQRLPSPNAQLLAVDKHVAAGYGHLLWSQNTLVIDIGEPINPGLILPESCRKLLRTVLVRSSTRALHDEVGRLWRPQLGDSPICLSSVRRTDVRTRMITFLDRAWAVGQLLQRLPSLECLILDFTECYGFDGNWFGYHTAFNLCCCRRGHLDNIRVEVQAPSVDRETNILRHIVRSEEDPGESPGNM